MPRPLDLTGLRQGRIVVVERAGRVHYGHDQSAWRVRCDCGREEVYPITRLRADRPNAPRVAACSMCSAPPCVICGAPRLNRREATCSRVCRAELTRQHQRAYYHRARRTDPEKAARARAAGIERWRTLPPEQKAATARARATWKRTREAADPALREIRLARARAAYAVNAAEIYARRRAYLDTLSPAQLEAWLERARRYSRAYRARWREQLAADPAAHRAYLDLLAEYRRRHALAALLREAPTLREISGE